jgi:microcystin-dependent protein
MMRVSKNKKRWTAMSEPYLGEIRMFAGNYAPEGWAFCNGQVLSIAENDALFTLLGTTYGGDGQTTFALPDLQGRIPIHNNGNYALGTKGGTETVTLAGADLAVHTHPPLASTQPGVQSTPSQNVWAAATKTIYSDGSGQIPVPMNSQLISSVGSGMPHDNVMPSLVVTFIIAMAGIFPQQG